MRSLEFQVQRSELIYDSKFVIRLCAFIAALWLGSAFFLAKTTLAQAPSPDQLCNPDTGVCQTDIGAVQVDPANFVNTVLNYAIPLGGSIALLLIIYGGFRIVSSNGNASEVAKGKETITYAIVGLVLILFSVLIVRVIGEGILQVPFFG